MRTILALLLFASPCFGQSFGQSFGTFTISSTAAIQAEKSQADTLIEVSKDRVQPREEFFVKIKDDMPYEIRGNPWYEKQEDLGKDGSRLVRLIAGDEDITIVVQHKIIKLTESDLKAMPLFASEEGREAWFYKNASDEVRDSRTVFVGGGPGPDPDPDPDPDPEPVTPPPIPVEGFRVMVIHEKGDNKPEYLRSIVAGREVNEYLEKACVTEPNGWSGFRFPDPHEDLSDDPQAEIWVPAMKRKRDSLPWVIISNGKTGFEGPLPKSVSEFLELCKKYEK